MLIRIWVVWAELGCWLSEGYRWLFPEQETVKPESGMGLDRPVEVGHVLLDA